MAGLGSVNDNSGLYLSLAGGFIWNRKADASDPNYATQTFVKADKSEGVRMGARYADITGNITGVQFRTHQEYGQSINVSFEAGEEKYIVSIGTNNRYGQDMMKALLHIDLTKEVYLKPYDFIGKDKKRAQGCSFRQDGEKIALRYDPAPSHPKEWFQEASKKDIKRFFEDLTEWFVAEVEEKVCCLFMAEKTNEKPKSGLGSASENVSHPADELPPEPTKKKVEKTKKKVEKTVVEKEPAKVVTAMKMKRALKAYIAENYPDEELPKLDKADLTKWYNLSLEDEELPFEKDDTSDAEVSSDDLDAQLDNLL